jgi:hypothetical protein
MSSLFNYKFIAGFLRHIITSFELFIQIYLFSLCSNCFSEVSTLFLNLVINQSFNMRILPTGHYLMSLGDYLLARPSLQSLRTSDCFNMDGYQFKKEILFRNFSYFRWFLFIELSAV